MAQLLLLGSLLTPSLAAVRHSNSVHMRYSGMRIIVAISIAAIVVLTVAAFAGMKLDNRQNSIALDSVERASVSKNIVVRESALQAPAPKPASANASFDQPQIARTGNLSLFVGNVDNAVSSISQLAHRQGGDVFSLQVNNADAATKATATMEIRVPAQRLDAAMNAAAQIGKVRERSVSAQDLTSNLTDSSARLRNLRRTESDIRKIMDRSGSIAQVLDAENQLSQVREQIETLESQLKSMRTQVAYATISVNIEAEAASAPVEPTPLSQLASAWSAAVHAVAQTTVGLIAVLLWLLVFVPYAAIAVAAAYVTYKQIRKHGATIAP